MKYRNNKLSVTLVDTTAIAKKHPGVVPAENASQEAHATVVPNSMEICVTMALSA